MYLEEEYFLKSIYWILGWLLYAENKREGAEGSTYCMWLYMVKREENQSLPSSNQIRLIYGLFISLLNAFE